MGVHSGDWIEYNVTSTGAPMQGHDVEWARMEVTAVQTPNINVTITSRFTDGTNDTIKSVLNLETGQLIDDFIIPANLNVGDSFKDQNYGNVTISNSEVKTYAGAQRTILSASIHNNTYYWDQATGVSVEGNTETADYSIHSVVSATNMWQATPVQGYDFASIILVAAVFLIVIIAFIAYVVHYIRKRACEGRQSRV
ncbi:MAG TPA: hypothetical protein VLH35_05175 [Candidatus Acidoferrales bacterium]|nr:hypothetical protein [Candidatus Acidoferrales bacterium]